MKRSPYQVLGVAPDATDEQIKAAYRSLARQNHPDNFSDPKQIAQASERMKEINEAYGALRRMRAAGNADANRSENRSSAESASPLAHIRAEVQAGRYNNANRLLEQVPDGSRGAEWNFLMGCVLTQKGWYFDAQKHLEIACYMDPNNTEYREFLNNIRSAASTYGKGYRSDAPGSGTNICDTCMSLACLDCMCDCFGGDFLRCC